MYAPHVFEPPENLPPWVISPAVLPDSAEYYHSRGGANLDEWGYRWGQFIDTVWLWYCFPADITVGEVEVNIHKTSLEIKVRDVTLAKGMLKEADRKTHGCDVEGSTWSLVTHDRPKVKVLQIMLAKEISMWWLGVFEEHPFIDITKEGWMMTYMNEKDVAM